MYSAALPVQATSSAPNPPSIEFGVDLPVVEDKLAIRVAGKGPFETQALFPTKGPSDSE